MYQNLQERQEPEPFTIFVVWYSVGIHRKKLWIGDSFEAALPPSWIWFCYTHKVINSCSATGECDGARVVCVVSVSGDGGTMRAAVLDGCVCVCVL